MAAFQIEKSVVLITGGNTGIGKTTAVGLARMGARVVFTSRDAERGRAALEDVRRDSGRDSVECMSLDLASVRSIRAFAREFLGRFDRLDVLVNNAGLALTQGERQLTEDGFERQFGVNHLGHFLLTDLLLPRIRASAPARIVVVSSDAYRMVPGGLDFDDLQRERDYRAFIGYGYSKLANVHFMTELARRLRGTGITVNAVHPGYVATELGRTRPEDRERQQRGAAARAAAASSASGGRKDSGTPDLSQLPPPIPAEDGARTSIWLASSPEVERVTGRYFSECAPVELPAFASDPDAAARLWKVSEQLIAGAGT